MLRWCFFIALFTAASANHEPLVPVGEAGEEVAAGLVTEFIELSEPGLRLGDAEDLYGWRCGDEPVGCIFIARTGGEGPVTWEEYNRLKHAFMDTSPRVGEELSPGSAGDARRAEKFPPVHRRLHRLRSQARLSLQRLPEQLPR